MSHVSFAFSAVLIFEEKISLVNILSHLSSLPIELHYIVENTTRIFLWGVRGVDVVRRQLRHFYQPSQFWRPFFPSRLPAHFPATVKELWAVTSALFYEWQHSDISEGKLSVQTFLQLWWIPLIRKYYFKIFLFLCRKTNPSFSSIKSWKQIKEGTETTKQIFYFCCKNNGKIFWLNRADAFWRA